MPDSEYGLGRLYSPDIRDNDHPMLAIVQTFAPPVQPTVKYWWDGGWWGNQGATSQCVVYSTMHWLADGPIRQHGPHPLYLPNAYYHECQLIDEWPGECVDMDTQCLTPEGWRNGADLRVGDMILTFDINTETTRWQVVEAVHRYSDAAYRVWSQKGFASAVTDNHRWPVRLRSNGSGFPRPYRMTTTAEWRPGDEFPRSAMCSDQPVGPKWDDDLVELIAWVMCEGYYRPGTRRGHGIVVSQKVYRDRVADLMQRLGVAPGSRKADGTHCWEIGGELAGQVRDLAPGRAPRIDWLMSLTIRQLRLFIDVCTMADGNVTVADGVRSDRTTFSQKPGPILDAWLAATALVGQPVQRARAGDVEQWTLRTSGAVGVRRLTPSECQHGEVWCPQTVAGTFVARRHGSVFVTGNSYDGTSVRASMKLLVRDGLVTSYNWTTDANVVAQAVLGVGPVIMGTNWYGSMMTPTKGILRVDGSISGGHAWVINGYNSKTRMFRMKNSWGRNWGLQGRAFISFENVQRLLSEQGEAALAVEKMRLAA